jgi:small redox-active disulfide protein 2
MKDIKVLGPGCPNCEKMKAMVREIIEAKVIEAEITVIKEFKDIATYGVLTTPGLVIDGEVMVSGRVPTKQELEDWLS